MGEDLALQPAFEHIGSEDRYLLAEIGVNLSFSWIIDWLELTYTPNLDDEDAEDITDKQDPIDVEQHKQEMLRRCTRQMQILMYGAYNWKSSEETVIED